MDTSISTASTLVSPTPQVPNSSSKLCSRVYYCPYAQYHLDLGKPPPEFQKKGDCKVHMNLFHNLGKEWPCPRCYKKFDRENDFVKHFGYEHRGHTMGTLTDIVTTLLPKRVFGCGFHDCENLSTSWEQWFNHIASHMTAGVRPAQWSDSVVISNLLRQNLLRQPWENLLYQIHGTCRPLLVWKSAIARVLCQKLECQDFRPGIASLVQAAYRLGRPDFAPIYSLPGQVLQTGLETPTCDSVPEYRDNNHLDELLKRNMTDDSPLQPSDANSPYFDYLPHIGPSPQNFDPDLLESMTGHSTPAGPIVYQPGEIQNFVGFALPGYETEQMQSFSDFSGMDVDENRSHYFSPDSSRFDPFSNQHTQSPTVHYPMDLGSTHILQTLNYFDYSRFARENTPRPRTPAGLLRRAKSSMSLSSKKSRSSFELEPNPAAPPVPPVPSAETDHSGRTRSSSQRSRLCRTPSHQLQKV